MNIWLVFILAVIIIHYLLDTIVSIVNLKALSPHLPEEFSDTYDREKYSKSQDYTKATTKLSLVENSLSTVITVLFIIGGGFNIIDRFARSLEFGSIVTGLIFTGCLLFLSFMVGLPFSLYSTFSIEERFGFNRTTAWVFVTDTLKGLVLGVIIGAPLLAAVLWFFENVGAFAWLYCWAGVVSFGILLQFLAPILIMPLFNKFTPLDEGPLKEKILAYAEKERFALKGIFTMDGSKRSAKLNAFFTGFGRFRKIVFFDTLLNKLDDDEIISVLAHEMGHFKNRHILKRMGSSMLQTGLMFFLLSLFIENAGLFKAFGMEHLSVYASLIFFAFLYAPLSTLLSIFSNYLSRIHEFEADRYAAETTGKPEVLVNSLKKLSLENLSNLTPHPLMVAFSYSHPPVLARIKSLKRMKI